MDNLWGIKKENHSPKRLAHPRSPMPPLSTLTTRATHALQLHPAALASVPYMGLYWFEFEFESRGCLNGMCVTTGARSVRGNDAEKKMNLAQVTSNFDIALVLQPSRSQLHYSTG